MVQLQYLHLFQNDSSKSNKSDFKIKIESGGTWRLDLIVDGHHSLIRKAFQNNQPWKHRFYEV